MDDKISEWTVTHDRHDYWELLCIAEPNELERDAIDRCIQETDVYKTYVARNKKERNKKERNKKERNKKERNKKERNKKGAQIIGLIITVFLPHTQTLHIEDYVIHPDARGKGVGRALWNDFTSTHGVNKLTIEVYPKNIEVWHKIMGVNVLFDRVLPVTGETVTWMGHNVNVDFALCIEREWLAIQVQERDRVSNKL